ncbi:MAG: hypothetical protein U1F83_14920 [Verrucomicrobiota bacterium]
MIRAPKDLRGVEPIVWAARRQYPMGVKRGDPTIGPLERGPSLIGAPIRSAAFECIQIYRFDTAG